MDIKMFHSKKGVNDNAWSPTPINKQTKIYNSFMGAGTPPASLIYTAHCPR